MRPTHQYITLYGILLTLATALAACTDELAPDIPCGDGYTDRIIFGVSEEGGFDGTRSDDTPRMNGNFTLRGENKTDTLCAAITISDFDCGNATATSTRAALVTTATMHNTFSVSGYMSAASESTPVWKAYFENERNAKPADPSGVWTYTGSNMYYWPGAKYNMRFCAVSPAPGGNITFFGSTDGNPGISYTVPIDLSQQTDLLACRVEKPGDFYQKVPLPFDHICTAVQFVQGPSMPVGSIRSVTISNAYCSGTYRIADGEWTLSSDRANYTQTFGNNGQRFDHTDTGGDAARKPITDDSDCFVMMPQKLPLDAKIEVTYYDDVSQSAKTVSASLGGQTWPMGKRVKYTLDISANAGFTITQNEVDAHYTILKTRLNVKDVAAGVAWKIVAPTLDNGIGTATESVTIQNQTEMNEFAAMGYWTDRKMQGGIDRGSARGETIYTGKGSGSFDIAIFVPEYLGKTDREITLDVRVTDSASGNDVTVATIPLKQYAPEGIYGWERIDDNESGEFGFDWDQKSEYLIPFDAGSEQTAAKAVLDKLIADYNALGYTVTDRKRYQKGFLLYRTTWFLVIDYSKMKLTGDYSALDGYANTSNLINFAKGAIGKQFETALQAVTKRSSGVEDKNEPLFRHPSEYEINENTNREICGETGLFDVKGNKGPGSTIFSYIAKKNAYNLKATVESGEITDWVAEMKDLKWYMPAWQQFVNNPPSVLNAGGINAYWSSTAITSGDNSTAYSGSGTATTRAAIKYVRACRLK